MSSTILNNHVVSKRAAQLIGHVCRFEVRAIPFGNEFLKAHLWSPVEFFSRIGQIAPKSFNLGGPELVERVGNFISLICTRFSLSHLPPNARHQAHHPCQQQPKNQTYRQAKTQNK